jgi:capsular polysaccharide biosynthesis protein
MLGFGVTVFICLLYAYARVVFNDTLIDVGDVKAIGVIPVLGVIPRLPPSPSGAPNDPSQKKGASGVV